MKTEIKIPSLGESISEVTIGQLLSANGSVVTIDAELLELETDKVNQILYASAAGQLQLTVKSGDRVQVGQVIGIIDTEKATIAEKPIVSPTETKTEKKLESPVKNEPESPISLQLTKENFLDELKSNSSSEPKVHVSFKAISSKENRETRRPLSKIRQVIAKRLVEAQHATAMLTTFNEVDMTAIIEMREKYKEPFLKKYGSKLGFMSFFVKAVVSALKAYPQINSYITENELIERNYFDIGVAIGTEKGVIVPIIRDADLLGYADIEKTIEAYAKKAREGKLTLDDLQGGGFTITNGGTYGSLLSTPILIPPQCAILGMHKIEKRPVVIDDQICIRSMMYLALSYDHRIVDGKEAVSFLVHIKNILEDTSRMLLQI